MGGTGGMLVCISRSCIATSIRNFAGDATVSTSKKAQSVMRVWWSLRRRVVTGRAGCLTLNADSCWDTGESAVRTQDASKTRKSKKQDVVLLASPPSNSSRIDCDNPERARKQWMVGCKTNLAY